MTKTLVRPNEIRGFANEKLLNEHWNGKKLGKLYKPGYKKDFPTFKNVREYEQGAKKFFENPPKGTLTGIRKGAGWKMLENDIIQYNSRSNTFGIIGKDGVLRTMYKPKPKSLDNPFGYNPKFKSAKEYFYNEIRYKP